MYRDASVTSPKSPHSQLHAKPGTFALVGIILTFSSSSSLLRLVGHPLIFMNCAARIDLYAARSADVPEIFIFGDGDL